jgi:L-malate glycosyltransferase
VVGVEMASGTTVNLWRDVPRPEGLTIETLFPGEVFEELGPIRCVSRLARRVSQRRVAGVFFLGYHRPENFLGAAICRLLGKKAVLMTESKFDDFSRNVWKELAKAFLCLPYEAALVGGRRHKEYVEFLGMSRKPIEFGYDTVSMRRMVESVTVREAGESGFLAVARFVRKKNLPFLIHAHSRYVSLAGTSARPLCIVGEGEERSAVETARSEHVRPALVDLAGALQSPQIAAKMATATALCLPSTEEQWGLVINEALFFGLPVLVSSRAGSVDRLARNGVNGFVLEPEDLEAWAIAMISVSNEDFRSKASKASLELAGSADTVHFGRGARIIIEKLLQRTIAT